MSKKLIVSVIIGFIILVILGLFILDLIDSKEYYHRLYDSSVETVNMFARENERKADLIKELKLICLNGE